jgi:hypothetical protein
VSTHVCAKRDNSLRFDVLAIRIFASVKSDPLATELRSANGGMYRHEVLRGWYDIAIFFTAIFPQLQFWDLHLLVPVQPVRDLHSQVPQILPLIIWFVIPVVSL